LFFFWCRLRQFLPAQTGKIQTLLSAGGRKIELYGYGPGWDSNYRRNIMHYGYPRRNAVVSEYKVGTLILDVVRAADRQLIWRATASDEVYSDNSTQAGENVYARPYRKFFNNFRR